MAKRTEPKIDQVAQLKQDLKNGTFAPLYFFHGEERFLQEHYMALLKKKAISGPMEEFNFRRLTAETMSTEALRDAVEAMPMMADMTLVQVDDYNPYAQSEDTRQELIEILSDIPDTCCLVFYYDTVKFSYGADRGQDEEQEQGEKPKEANKKLLKQCIEKYGTVVEFQKQTGTALNDWISRHFRQGGKLIAPDLCQYLAFITGGDMTTLQSEIAKVMAYSRMETVTRQDIDAVVEPVLTAVVFDITDALAEGNYDKALLKLRDVLASQEEPIKVNAVVGSHFRKLLLTKSVMAAGKGNETLLPILNSKSDFYGNKLMQQARRLSDEMCANAVLLCYETDCKMKRSVDDSARLLELLLLSLAQEARK